MARVERLCGAPNIHYYYNAAASATTYDAGEWVGLDSDGKLVIGAAANILGIAMCDSPADTTTAVPVDVVCCDDSEFSMYFTSGGTSSETAQGVKYAGTFTTAGQTVGAAGSGAFVIIGPDNRDGWGLNKRVIVKVMSGATVTQTGQ